jgi:hypothetical protein
MEGFHQTYRHPPLLEGRKGCHERQSRIFRLPFFIRHYNNYH